MSGRHRITLPGSSGRRFLAPEVIQTSAMDCGPAVLKSILEGFRIPVSYGRLRDACQTDVDGTSIDSLEEIASELDLQAEQIIVPADHVLLKQAGALPALAVVTSPIGSAHFIVVWRSHGRLVQIMDPARGRLWLPRHLFVRDLYIHTATVAASEWRQWAGSGEFVEPLAHRLRKLGVPARERRSHIEEAVADPTWAGLAALDASARMVASLRTTRTLGRSQVRSALSALVPEARKDPSASTVPVHYWSVRPADGFGAECASVHVRGVVLMRARGRKPSIVSASSVCEISGSATSPEISAAREEEAARPVGTVLRALQADGLLEPAVAVSAVAIAALGVVAEAALLRSVLDASFVLRLPEQAAAAALALATFVLALLALELVLGTAERRAGRRLETRLRIALLERIPRLADAYLQSRPVSDMLERVHSLHLVRTLPQLAFRFLRVGAELVITTAAIAWLAPETAGWALATAVSAVVIPLLGYSVLAERDLRVRTHVGALGRFQLDALLGRTTLDAHGAGAALEGEHERLLCEWSRSSLALQRGSLVVEGFQMLTGFALAGWILLGGIAAEDAGAMLLLAYWVLNLPALGYEMALCAREYPCCRNTLLRILEPLSAPEALTPDRGSIEALQDGLEWRPSGARIQMRSLGVRAAGHLILNEINLEIEAGSHVAIVGSSGAGKSTLAGLLLGWHRPSAGELLVDGEPLTNRRLHALRGETAWVDPSVQIWNTSLLDNLLYGCAAPPPVGSVLEMTGLIPVVANLPEGLATPLGESGSLLSAGEAQRVRLARAMLQSGIRLAILDEPFLGLERDRRKTLLSQVRQHWSTSTLLYVTHDVAEARSFDRVLVLEHGRIVEDSDPRILARTASSRYRRLLQAQDAVQARLEVGGDWNRVHLREGQIVQDHEDAVIERTA